MAISIIRKSRIHLTHSTEKRQKVEARLETKLHAVNDVMLEGPDGQGPMPVDLRLKGVPDAPEGNVERASRVSEA